VSREPSSPMHRQWKYHEKVSPPPEPENPKSSPPKRIPRVRVENAGQDKAIQKLLTTTEQLTAEERRIVRGYRLSSGGDAERIERARIELDILKEND
jgi:hypothetical protein